MGVATMTLHERAEQLAKKLFGKSWTVEEFDHIESALRDVVEECARVAEAVPVHDDPNTVCGWDCDATSTDHDEFRETKVKVAAAIRRLKEEI